MVGAFSSLALTLSPAEEKEADEDKEMEEEEEAAEVDEISSELMRWRLVAVVEVVTSPSRAEKR